VLFDFDCYIQTHINANLFDISQINDQTTALITFWNNTDSVFNSDLSRTNFDTIPIWDRVYRIYFTMLASMSNKELIKPYTQKLVYALTQNENKYQTSTPSGVEFISYLKGNRQDGEISFTIEQESLTSPNYITADFQIIFTILSTQYKTK
jgi:uncharacterized hydantoinase/oxoprolinase family protein